MSSQKDNSYLRKASEYDMLSNFFKYRNHSYSIYYYQKHLEYLNKAINQKAMRESLVDQMHANSGRLRILNASIGLPALDVYLNGMRIFQNIAYKQLTGYLSLPEGSYHIEFHDSAQQTRPLLSKRITVILGESYTYPLTGLPDKLSLVSVKDNLFVPASETKIRFVHLSPDTESVDIAVKEGDVVFPKVTYRNVTDYLGLTPMSVHLEIRESGTKNILLPLSNQRYKPDQAYTIFILGSRHDETGIFIVTGNP
jgi:hypothetical protein